MASLCRAAKDATEAIAGEVPISDEGKAAGRRVRSGWKEWGVGSRKVGLVERLFKVSVTLGGNSRHPESFWGLNAI